MKIRHAVVPACSRSGGWLTSGGSRITQTANFIQKCYVTLAATSSFWRCLLLRIVRFRKDINCCGSIIYRKASTMRMRCWSIAAAKAAKGSGRILHGGSLGSRSRNVACLPTGKCWSFKKKLMLQRSWSNSGILFQYLLLDISQNAILYFVY